MLKKGLKGRNHPRVGVYICALSINSVLGRPEI